MEFEYEGGLKVSVERQGDGYRITIGDRTYEVRVNRSAPGELTFTADGQRYHAYIAQDGPHRYIAFDSNVYSLVKADPVETSTRPKRAPHGGQDSLSAAMPGQVANVLVSEGDTVTRGQALVILEAMKMEIRVSAPHDGRVARVHCQKGQIVERGQTLLELIE